MDPLLTVASMFSSERLPTFFADLRSAGFSVGLNEQQRVIDLLVHLNTSRMMPENSEQLCNMLGAVLCCTPEQQTQFRREFTSYFGTWTYRELPAPTPLPPGITATVPIGPPTSRRRYWRPLNSAQRTMLTRGAIALLLVVISYLVVKVDWSTLMPPGPIVSTPQPIPVPEKSRGGTNGLPSSGKDRGQPGPPFTVCSAQHLCFCSFRS
jgi:hypothetical protein